MAAQAPLEHAGDAESPAESLKSCCPAHDTETVLNGLHPALRIWLRPIRDELVVVSSTFDKPLGQFTMPELMAWGTVFCYAAATGMIAGRLAGNLAVTILRGPVIRR